MEGRTDCVAGQKAIQAHSDSVLTANRWYDPFKIKALVRNRAGTAYKLVTFDGKDVKYAVASDRLKNYNVRNLNYFYNRDDACDGQTNTDNSIQPQTTVHDGTQSHSARRRGLKQLKQGWYDAIKVLRDKQSTNGRLYYVLFEDNSRSWCDDISEDLLRQWIEFKRRRAVRRRLKKIRR